MAAHECRPRPGSAPGTTAAYAPSPARVRALLVAEGHGVGGRQPWTEAAVQNGVSMRDSAPHVSPWKAPEANRMPARPGVGPRELDDGLDSLAPRAVKNPCVSRPPARSHSAAASSPASSGTWLCSMAGPPRSSSARRSAISAGDCGRCCRRRIPRESRDTWSRPRVATRRRSSGLADVHAEHVEQAHPLGVDVLGVQGVVPGLGARPGMGRRRLLLEKCVAHGSHG